MSLSSSRSGSSSRKLIFPRSHQKPKLSRFSYTIRDLLLHGFIHKYVEDSNNSNSTQTIIIPLAIIELCRTFWYRITYEWKLYGSSFNRFCSSSRTLIKKQYIHVNKTEIECVIVRKPENKQTSLYLKTDYNNYPLKTYFELYCRETKCEHRGIKTFGKTSVVSMDLGDIDKHKAATMSIYIDPRWNRKNNKIHSCFQYKWKLTPSQLEYVKKIGHEQNQNYGVDCSQKYLLSDNFDGDHWYLKLYPNDDGNVYLYLVLLALKTKKIYCMDVEYSLQCSFNYKKIEIEDMKTFTSDSLNTESKTWKCGSFPNEALLELNELEFDVNIEIIGVYDDSLKMIKSPYVLPAI